MNNILEHKLQSLSFYLLFLLSIVGRIKQRRCLFITRLSFGTEQVGVSIHLSLLLQHPVGLSSLLRCVNLIYNHYNNGCRRAVQARYKYFENQATNTNLINRKKIPSGV